MNYILLFLGDICYAMGFVLNIPAYLITCLGNLFSNAGYPPQEEDGE